jgi:hypothetical protein
MSSSDQSSWLQIQRSGFDSWCFQIFWVVGLEWGLLSLVSTIEELLERKSSSSGLENREYGCGDPLCWPRGTLYPQKLALTSPTSGRRSVGIVCSRTQATEIFFFISNQAGFVDLPASCAMTTRDSPPGSKASGPHSVLRLRMHEAVFPLCHVFMVWCLRAAALLFFLLKICFTLFPWV